MVYSLFIIAPIVCEFVCVWSLFCFAVLCVMPFLILQSSRWKELVALILLCSECRVAVIVL